MFVSSLRLVNFRSYCDATVRFGPGLNVVVGENAAGKTNLLEGAWFALRGTSPRTRRDEKLITWGERFARVELELDGRAAGRRVDVGFAPGQGKRVRWDGVEVASLDDLRGRSQVFIFVPESLLLVKGSPARRRAHLDAFAAALDPRTPPPRATCRRRCGSATRNCARSRTAPPGARSTRGTRSSRGPPSSWGAAAATSCRARGAVRGGRRRAGAGGRGASACVSWRNWRASATTRTRCSRNCARGGRARSAAACRCSVRTATTSGSSKSPRRRRADAAGRAARRAAARCRRAAGRRVPSRDGGPVCGPVELPGGGRDLRLFGSQGEQRAAVLALLLAEQRLAAARTGERARSSSTTS